MVNKKSTYLSCGYESLERWHSYWHQIDEVVKLKQDNILEIGIGSGLVSYILKSYGFKITTLDNDKRLNPDLCIDLLDLPYKKKEFGIILCAQVLEHLPFEKLEKALILFAKASQYLILTLPHAGPVISLKIKLPLLKEIRFFNKFYFPQRHKFNGKHCWEIGKLDTPFNLVKKKICQNYKIIRHYIPLQSPWHHFFILKSKIK